jgi:SP family sugar:H+ symporter-like MFS transporter
MPYWEDQFSTGYVNPLGHKDVTASQSAEIVSILSAGTFFGALTAAPFGDFLGRRMGLIASCIVFIFGVILQTAATSLSLFIAGRFFAGFGVGLVSALSMVSLSFFNAQPFPFSRIVSKRMSHC